MSIGAYISGAAHVGLLGWVVLNGEFTSKPLDVPVTEVSVISSEVFDIMVNNIPPLVDVASLDIVPPAVTEAAPDLSSVPDTQPDLADLSQAIAPNQDAVPETRPAPLVQPEEVVLAPPPEPQAPVVEETAMAARPVANAAPRQAPRVAPQAVQPPLPDIEIGEITRDLVAPEPDSQEVVDPGEARVQEAASTEIVTEAEQSNAAPGQSMRPQNRPSLPPIVDQGAEVDPLAAALAEALAGGASDEPSNVAADAPSSTLGEDEARALSLAALQGMQIAITQCWNVGALSTDALQTVVKVGMEMSIDGRPIEGSYYLATSSGGSQNSVQQAYETAKRAIQECGAQGFDLPVEHFEVWRYVEMTFNPEQMRGR